MQRKPASKQAREADAGPGGRECRHHPGRHHRRDQFAGDEQAGWAAGVDGRRNAQGCPGWRGWRSRWRRSRSICGASRRQGRHRARGQLGACQRLTLWHTRSPGCVIRAGSLLTHGSSCLIGKATTSSPAPNALAAWHRPSAPVMTTTTRLALGRAALGERRHAGAERRPPRRRACPPPSTTRAS